MAETTRFTLYGGPDPGGARPALPPGAAFGLSLGAPGFPAPAGAAPEARLVLLGPAEGGFAPSVNVIVQDAPATPDAYIEASVLQFGAAGYVLHATTRRRVSGREAVIFDYEGTQQGAALRWLALAVFDAGRVCLVTCTTKTEDFAGYEKEMRALLDGVVMAG